MKIELLICVGALVLTLGLFAPARTHAKPLRTSPQPGSTASASSATSPAMMSPAKSRLISFRGMIASADQKAKTFMVTGKEKSRSIHVTDKTIITKFGQPATMKDVIDNQEVRGTAYKDANGLFEAKMLKLGPLTDAEKAAEKSYKEIRTERKIGGSPATSPTASAPAGPKT